MRNPLPVLTLLACAALPSNSAAQYASPPGYTFGGMMPNMFGGQNYAMPQGFMNNGQSPFLTMPLPQYPMANPQFPGAQAQQASPYPANPMTAPLPFWMQTPQAGQAPARYISEVPTTAAPENAQPAYTFFNPQAATAGPPRWAPLTGDNMTPFQMVPSINNWSVFPQNGQNAAPIVPATPPKWPTP